MAAAPAPPSRRAGGGPRGARQPPPAAGDVKHRPVPRSPPLIVSARTAARARSPRGLRCPSPGWSAAREGREGSAAAPPPRVRSSPFKATGTYWEHTGC
ncbi:hypothetical protein AV530_004507 [Patagioenas fasciata monilis]|uniref:Uncharacterized protein n=1 Tax=Patagioenas fasciata monilis TaxID=372326 RepID=A0A1V4JCF7_PATFA|nr:hypothetical protein AV530_004507 [Patagioenas fasciata monilis]